MSRSRMSPSSGRWCAYTVRKMCTAVLRTQSSPMLFWDARIWMWYEVLLVSHLIRRSCLLYQVGVFFLTNTVWLRDGIAYQTPHAFTPVHLAVNARASIRLLLDQYKNRFIVWLWFVTFPLLTVPLVLSPQKEGGGGTFAHQIRMYFKNMQMKFSAIYWLDLGKLKRLLSRYYTPGLIINTAIVLFRIKLSHVFGNSLYDLKWKTQETWEKEVVEVVRLKPALASLGSWGKFW